MADAIHVMEMVMITWDMFAQHVMERAMLAVVKLHVTTLLYN